MGMGAMVGIFKFEMFIRHPNGNVLEVGFKSLCSGLKIHIWTPTAYSLYNSDTVRSPRE